MPIMSVCGPLMCFNSDKTIDYFGYGVFMEYADTKKFTEYHQTYLQSRYKDEDNEDVCLTISGAMAEVYLQSAVPQCNSGTWRCDFKK